MKNRVAILLMILVLAGFYAMTVTAKGNGSAPDPTRTAPPSPTEKPKACNVHTGIESGAVNLRECAGAVCGSVLGILTEGESVIIISPGKWLNVTTESGVTGWINSNYCK